MKIAIVFLVFVMAVCVHARHQDESQRRVKRIVGGHRASLRQSQYFAVIRKRGDTYAHCGASILSSHWIISAAGCWVEKDDKGLYFLLDPKDFEVLSQTVNLNPNQVRYKTTIERMVFTSGAQVFDPRTTVNDIVMIKVKDDLKSKPISLPSAHQDFTGKTGKASGFGAIGLGDPYSTVLKEVSLPILGPEKCASYGKNFINKSMICAGGEEGRDTCSRDTGGPLAVDGGHSGHTLAGIISHGRGCGQKGVPAVYTRVPAYLEFIHQTLRS